MLSVLVQNTVATPLLCGGVLRVTVVQLHVR